MDWHIGIGDADGACHSGNGIGIGIGMHQRLGGDTAVKYRIGTPMATNNKIRKERARGKESSK